MAKGSRQEQPNNSRQVRDAKGRFLSGNGLEFKPGESGNPNGRPPGNSVTEQIRSKLPRTHPKDKEGRSHSELIADVLLAMAEGRDLGAIKEVIDRSDGKVKEKVEHDFKGQLVIQRSRKGS